jgi:hypothetical protein
MQVRRQSKEKMINGSFDEKSELKDTSQETEENDISSEE